jgi:uncharacterized RDD family membrane protein YckC
MATSQAEYERGTTTARKADLGKRFLAHLIDSMAAGLAGAAVGFFFPALGGLISAGYFLVRDGLELQFMDRRSLGKHLMKLRPVRLDGAPMDIETSMRRNWMFAVAGLVQASFLLSFLVPVVSVAATAITVYEVYRVLTDEEGRRWGDELAGTMVVEAAA